MTIFEEKAVRELLTSKGLVVGGIELDYDKNIAEAYIDVNAVGLYATKEIGNIVKKIYELESLLMSQGFVHDIKFGDLYQGTWRILIHFLSEEEIDEWEKNAMK